MESCADGNLGMDFTRCRVRRPLSLGTNERASVTNGHISTKERRLGAVHATFSSG